MIRQIRIMLLFTVAVTALGIAVAVFYYDARRATEREKTAAVYEFVRQCGSEYELKHGARMDDATKTRVFSRAFDLLYTGGAEGVLNTGKSAFRKFKPLPSAEGVQAADASRVVLVKHRMRTELFDICRETTERHAGETTRAGE
ncbi:MAG: hypothetical protein AB2L13_13040 [Spirochaetota bacterium]